MGRGANSTNLLYGNISNENYNPSMINNNNRQSISYQKFSKLTNSEQQAPYSFRDVQRKALESVIARVAIHNIVFSKKYPDYFWAAKDLKKAKFTNKIASDHFPGNIYDTRLARIDSKVGSMDLDIEFQMQADSQQLSFQQASKNFQANVDFGTEKSSKLG
jgi:hypothetical protein